MPRAIELNELPGRKLFIYDELTKRDKILRMVGTPALTISWKTSEPSTQNPCGMGGGFTSRAVGIVLLAISAQWSTLSDLQNIAAAAARRWTEVRKNDNPSGA